MHSLKNKNKYLNCLAFVLLVSLYACTDIDSSRVNVAYAAWNISTEELTDINIGGYYKTKRLASYPHMTPRMGGILYFDKEVSLIIPQVINVSWDSDKAVGPYRVKLRSRIPNDVIRKATKTKYTLKIGVSVGKLPILVCWRLERSAHPKPGTYYVQQGGDC